jgi:hypothetical protein
VNDAARFVISRRAASQKDLSHWASDESMERITRNDCSVVGQAIDRVIEA